MTCEVAGRRQDEQVVLGKVQIQKLKVHTFQGGKFNTTSCKKTQKGGLKFESFFGGFKHVLFSIPILGNDPI